MTPYDALTKAAEICRAPVRYAGGASTTRQAAWTECRAAILALRDSLAAEAVQNDTAEQPCATCNDDPEVCATVPGLRHCEAALRSETAQPDYKVLWERDSSALGKCLQDIHNLRAVKEDQRARIAVLEGELAALRANGGSKDFVARCPWIPGCPDSKTCRAQGHCSVAAAPSPDSQEGE